MALKTGWNFVYSASTFVEYTTWLTLESDLLKSALLLHGADIHCCSLVASPGASQGRHSPSIHCLIEEQMWWIDVLEEA
jgi:hypothetical protein